jgi:hypothetical protein
MTSFIFKIFQIGIALLFLGALAELTMTLRTEAAKAHAHGLMDLGRWNYKLQSK